MRLISVGYNNMLEHFDIKKKVVLAPLKSITIYKSLARYDTFKEKQIRRLLGLDKDLCVLISCRCGDRIIEVCHIETRSSAHVVHDGQVLEDWRGANEVPV